MIQYGEYNMSIGANEIFLKHKKVDAHNHLNLGMRYSSYTQWSGFFIPDFPRKMNGLSEMHEIIANYTRPCCHTTADVCNLLEMSILDAIADCVTVLEGSVDSNFINHYKEDIDSFLMMVSNLVSKYASKIDFRPEFGMGKTGDTSFLQKWAPVCIKSGVFKSIDLYGPEVEEGIEDFKSFFKLAGECGLKRKAHVGEFSDAESVKKFIEFFELDAVQHGIGAAKDEHIIRFLADNHIQLNVCPASNVMLGAVPSLSEHPIKKLLDAGVPLTIGTDDLLFFDRTVSEQITDLVNEQIITKEDAFKIMDTGL